MGTVFSPEAKEINVFDGKGHGPRLHREQRTNNPA
jgi:hypothetical protein